MLVLSVLKPLSILRSSTRRFGYNCNSPFSVAILTLSAPMESETIDDDLNSLKTKTGTIKLRPRKNDNFSSGIIIYDYNEFSKLFIVKTCRFSGCNVTDTGLHAV